MKSTSLRTTLAGLLLASTCLVNVAHAALIDRGNGMIYDSTQNITWLQNANLAGTAMNWNASVAWASGLTVGGFTDWRLFNADPSCGFGFNCTANELGHLFYNEFGLSQYQSVATLVGGTNANFNLFTNVQSFVYWSGTEYASSTGSAWAFDTRDGLQGFLFKSGSIIYAWAVRDGDVAAVPEPGTLAMLGLGLFSLVVRRGLARQRR